MPTPTGAPRSARLSAEAWALAAGAAILNILSLPLGLYNAPGVGEALHFTTVFALTFLGAQLLSAHLPADLAVYFLLVLAVGLAIGAVWAIGQWLARTPSDPVADLLWDAAGATLAAVLAARQRAQRHGPL